VSEKSRVRVIHWGTGATGSYALRGILADPALELVGLHVTNLDKVGRDAGELVGVEPVGLTATSDVEALFDLRPDCLLYAGNGAGRELEAAQDMARFLERGIDVATISLISMVYPPAGPPPVRETLEKACEAGKSAFFNGGSSPGVVSADAILPLLSCAGRIDCVRIQEFVDNSRYPVPEAMRVSAGMGQPPGYVPPRVTGGIVEAWWAPLAHHVADRLGIALDSIDLQWETATTDRDIETAYGLVEAGTIGGLHWQLVGRIGGEVRIVVEHFMRAAPDVGPDWEPSRKGVVCKIEGDPKLEIQVSSKGIAGSLGVTAMHVVNAIPALVAADPGLKGPGDLPHYATRNVPWG
jgi:hypothetical protein